jgi:hypothetical protein
MHPVRISENLSSGAKTVGSLRGEIPRNLIVTTDPVESESLEDCDWSASLGRNPLYHGEFTNSSNNNSGDNKGHYAHPQSMLGTSKDVMKTINDGAAAYLSNKPSLGSSTSKIVDQALDVVKSKGSSERHSQYSKKGDDGDASQSSNRSSCTNTTATSSVTEPSQTSLSPQIGTQPEPNLIAPSLRKVAKKRRKEPDKNGVERSSFHHTKSSKEYLRKAQEALMKQQELCGSNTSSISAESASERSAESMHSPRTNFRMLCHVGGAADRTNMEADPFSQSSSYSNESACRNIQQDNNGANPYGYEDPDVGAASMPGDSNLYGYEDPDANAARMLPSARRMEPARRRGSVTKYSTQAAQAAKKATERIMRLQGLNWKGSTENSTRSIGCFARSTTPTRRRSHPRHAMETTSALTTPVADMTQSIMPVPVRRRSIPLNTLDNETGAVAPIDSSVDLIRTSDVAMEGFDSSRYINTATAGDTTPSKLSSNLYGYEDPDATASANAQPTSSMNPYGYGDDDACPRPLGRLHPRCRRRGSVTKFSLDAATIVTSMEPENSAPFKGANATDAFNGSKDFVMALKPPAEGRPVGFAPKNRRRVGLLTGDQGPESRGGILQLGRSSSSSSDQASDRRTAPRRNGSARSSSSRHLARFGAPDRSDSFLSHGSTASWEDDADSLAPDMESLCSIHDRGDLGFDFAPVPPAPGISPTAPGLTSGNMRKSLSRTFSGKSENGWRRALPEAQRSFSEYNSCPVVSDDIVVLPLATESRSNTGMPAPPVRPSHSTSTTSISSH